MSDYRIQIIITGIGLILVLALFLRLIYVYQRWLNNKMYNLGSKVHNSLFMNDKDKKGKIENEIRNTKS